MEIVGRVTADAKVNTIKDEKQVVNFTIAINDSYRIKGSSQPVKVTDYVNCSYWINPSISEHLTKGSLVELSGRIGVNAWTNTDGEAKAGLTFHVNNIKLHGKVNAPAKQNVSQANEVTEPIEDLPF